MAIRRRTDPVQGAAAVQRWRSGVATAREVVVAVRYSLEALAEIAPGHFVEVRVPPAAVVQAVAGPRHTRGTPPNVVETDMQTWLELATGAITWSQAVDSGAVHASGRSANLDRWLPVPGLNRAAGRHAPGGQSPTLQE